MNQLLQPRVASLVGFSACAALLAYAYFAQFVLGLEPCPLCILQRVGFIVLAIAFLVAAIHAPVSLWGRRIHGLVLLAISLVGASISIRHVWLQNLPEDEVPACGPGLDYMLDVFPLTDTLRMVFTGSGECAEVDWVFLGLSMPAWALIAFLLLGMGGFFVHWRRAG